MYSYLFFQSQCAVYVKLPFHAPDSPHFGYTQHCHFYVESTAVSVANEISLDRPNSNNSVTGRQSMWNFQFGIGAPAEILIFIIPSFWKLIPHMTMPGFENTA